MHSSSVRWSSALETEEPRMKEGRTTTVVEMDVSETKEGKEDSTIHMKREGQMEAELVRKNIVRLVLKEGERMWLKILVSVKTKTVKQICTRKYQITIGKGGTHLSLCLKLGTVWWEDGTGHFSPRVPHQSAPFGADLSWLETTMKGRCVVETIP